MGAEKHGLIAFDTDGEVHDKIPGHTFGRNPEMARTAIEEKVRALLNER